MTPPAFESILPAIEARSRRHYSRYPAERREEAVQESICHAYGLYTSAVARGNCRFTACSLAWFSNKAVDEGRKFAGGTIRTDALDRSHVGFDDLDRDGLRQVVEALIHETTPILDQIRVLVDYSEFMLLLPERESDVVRKLAEGWKKVEIAQHLGVSPARVTQLLAGVADAYVAYLGLPGFEHRARKQETRKPGRQPKKLRAVA
jgi:DNA-directed RNA polymerase specialized sigma24 family protein